MEPTLVMGGAMEAEQRIDVLVSIYAERISPDPLPQMTSQHFGFTALRAKPPL